MYAAVDTSDYDSPEVWIFPDKESVEQFARDYDGDVWVVSVSNGQLLPRKDQAMQPCDLCPRHHRWGSRAYAMHLLGRDPSDLFAEIDNRRASR